MLVFCVFDDIDKVKGSWYKPLLWEKTGAGGATNICIANNKTSNANIMRINGVIFFIIQPIFDYQAASEMSFDASSIEFVYLLFGTIFRL